jgi:hypothetical protein
VMVFSYMLVCSLFSSSFLVFDFLTLHSQTDSNCASGKVYFDYTYLPLRTPLFTSSGNILTRTSKDVLILKCKHTEREKRLHIPTLANIWNERGTLNVWERGVLSDGWTLCSLSIVEHGFYFNFFIMFVGCLWGVYGVFMGCLWGVCGVFVGCLWGEW